MKLNKFAVPYTDDQRMIYAKEYLEKLGYTYVTDADDAQFIVLPLPVKAHMLNSLEDKIIFLGKGDYHGTYDYYKRESFVLKNAYLTAEGAIALAQEKTKISLYRSDILICGYGRIGKSLHKALSGYGANITVCSRSKESVCESIYNGAKHINMSDLKNKNNYDIVFNTVPHIIFTDKELKALKHGVCLIDLASFPGGVDTLVANSIGINLIDGRSMPTRYCVKTAGYLIGEAIDEILEEVI